MQCINKTLSQKLWCVMILVFICPLTSCRASSSPPSNQLPTYCQPELLFLLPEPYNRIYVEVDKIDNVEIPKGILGELKEFLAKYCVKSNGIEIIMDDVIPQPEYKDRTVEIVANLFIDGPPHDANNTQTAYMYILFYDSKKMGKQRSFKTPHVNFPYACVIYYDVDFARIVGNRVGRNFLLHEAGHVLGLCKNTEHGDGAHCVNQGCLMSSIEVSITKSILGLPMKKLDLCVDCRKDIEMVQATNPTTKMSFNGPFLVRQEQGYWVASLPVSDVVSFSGTDTFDWGEILTNIKVSLRNYEKALQNDPHSRLHYFMPYDTGDSSKAMRKELVKLYRASQDPNPSVRIGATKTIKKIETVLSKESLPSQSDDTSSDTP